MQLNENNNKPYMVAQQLFSFGGGNNVTKITYIDKPKDAAHFLGNFLNSDIVTPSSISDGITFTQDQVRQALENREQEISNGTPAFYTLSLSRASFPNMRGGHTMTAVVDKNPNYQPPQQQQQ